MIRKTTITTVLLLLAVLFCASVHAESITVNLPENKSRVIDENGIAKFTNCDFINLANEPALPVTFMKVLLPENADLSTIRAKLSSITEKKTRTNLSIPLLPPLKTTDGDYQKTLNQNKMFGRQGNQTKTNEIFPKNSIRSIRLGKMGTYKIADIIVQRYTYNFSTKEMTELKNGVLKINFSIEKNRKEAESVSPEMFTIASEIICNYNELVSTYPSPIRNRKSGYVVATTKEFLDRSTYLEKFMQVKKNEGFDVTVITESDWGGSTGSTAAQNIRNWLKNNKDSKNIKFLFIIGNPTKSSKVPMVDGPHASDDIPLVDYCYADLSGDLSRGDNRFHEYALDGAIQTRFDQYPEISVGRIPIYNNDFSEADMLLKRMTDYMTEDSASAESYRFNAIMPLNTFNDAQNGICFGEEVKKRLLDPNNFSCKRIYYNHAGTSAEFPCSFEKTVSVWNAGKFGLMVLQGHGLPTFAEKALDTKNTYNIETDGYVHGFNISCNNGRPQEPQNLGYAILKNEGISEIASAVQIWYSTTTTSNYGKYGNGNDFAFSYMDNLINYKKGAATCFNKTRASLKITSANDWQNLCELNLYGCPAIGLYTYGVPDENSTIELNNGHMISPKFVATVDKLKISLKNNEKFKGKLKIYDINGKTLYNELVSNNDFVSLRKEQLGEGLRIVEFRGVTNNGKLMSLREKIIIR